MPGLEIKDKPPGNFEIDITPSGLFTSNSGSAELNPLFKAKLF